MEQTANIQKIEICRPEWAKEKHIDEMAFCQAFSEIYPLVWVDGAFFSPQGMEPESRVRKWIYDTVKPYYAFQLHKKVSNLMEILKMELQQEDFPQSEALIHCKNGTYNVVRETFSTQKCQCRYRLPVNYDPKAPTPRRWLSFLHDLLEEEDILTLQEFLGYCLVPANYAQRMLLIIGNGGEGKSRIGIIASHLMGSSMVNGSLCKLEKSPFARADLQHKLLMVDDDLQMEALASTGIIKSIITAEQPMDLERKGIQSYQGRLFCRLMAFGNGNLQSLHDRSHGFFRRQIILTAKPRPEERQDNPYLAQEMIQELEGILLWCIQGLIRLLQQDMKFTISSSATNNLRNAEHEGNNILDFLQSEHYIRLDPRGEISTRRLYGIYKDWCDDNMLSPFSAKTFSSWLQANAQRFSIQYSNRISSGNGRLVRGFRGIRPAGQF